MNDSRVATRIYAVTNYSCQYSTAPNPNLLSVGGESVVSSVVEDTLVASGRGQLGSESVLRRQGKYQTSFPAVFMPMAPSAAVPTAVPNSSVHSSQKSGKP